MKADNGWTTFPQPSPKQLLLAFKFCQSVSEGAAVISFLDGCDDPSDLAFDGREVDPISLELLLALGCRTVDLLTKGSNELTHQFRCHEPPLKAVQNTCFDFLPVYRRVVVAGPFAAPCCTAITVLCQDCEITAAAPTF